MTGPLAIGVALALAAALVVLSSNWRAERADYEARIVALSQAGERVQASLRSELAACHAGQDSRRLVQARAEITPTKQGGGAKRLLEQQPAGIDACARMESADQAVLSNLKK